MFSKNRPKTFMDVVVERGKAQRKLKYDILKVVKDSDNPDQINLGLLNCLERYIPVVAHRIRIENQHRSVFHFEHKDIVLLFGYLFSKHSMPLGDLFGSNTSTEPSFSDDDGDLFGSNTSTEPSFSDDDQAVLIIWRRQDITCY